MSSQPSSTAVFRGAGMSRHDLDVEIARATRDMDVTSPRTFAGPDESIFEGADITRLTQLELTARRLASELWAIDPRSALVPQLERLCAATRAAISRRSR